jgi:cysteine synthase
MQRWADKLLCIERMIGHTPVHDIRRLCGTVGPVLAKCEHQNPTGSHKVRAYIAMLQAAARCGRLHPGIELVDYSTGNAGAALAWLAHELGFACSIIMPEGLPAARYRQVRQAGAEVILSDGPAMNTPAAKTRAIEYCDGRMGRLLFDQLCNPANVVGLETLGHEIVMDVRARHIDRILFVAGYGTGATLSAVAHAVAEGLPGSRIVAVEIDGARHLAERDVQSYAFHNVLGYGPPSIGPLLDRAVIDDVISVSASDAHAWTRTALASSGEWVGTSSGANLAAIHAIVRRSSSIPWPIVTLFWDAGWKYAAGPAPEVNAPMGARSEQNVLV